MISFVCDLRLACDGTESPVAVDEFEAEKEAMKAGWVLHMQGDGTEFQHCAACNRTVTRWGMHCQGVVELCKRTRAKLAGLS